MRFLIDPNMPRSTGRLLAPRARGGSGARQHGLALVTRDFDFSDLRNYPPEQYAGIVVLQLPDDAVASRIVRVFECFLAQPELVKRLPARLAIVESWRVRFRPN